MIIIKIFYKLYYKKHFKSHQFIERLLIGTKKQDRSVLRSGDVRPLPVEFAATAARELGGSTARAGTLRERAGQQRARGVHGVTAAVGSGY